MKLLVPVSGVCLHIHVVSNRETALKRNKRKGGYWKLHSNWFANMDVSENVRENKTLRNSTSNKLKLHQTMEDLIF